MIKLIRMFIFSLCFGLCSNLFTPIQSSSENISNEMISKDFNLLHDRSHGSEKNLYDQPIEKTTSKSRQRMSGGKIFGIVIAVIYGAVLGGLLLGAVIVPSILALISICFR